jgi:hypothetical protein
MDRSFESCLTVTISNSNQILNMTTQNDLIAIFKHEGKKYGIRLTPKTPPSEPEIPEIPITGIIISNAYITNGGTDVNGVYHPEFRFLAAFWDVQGGWLNHYYALEYYVKKSGSNTLNPLKTTADGDFNINKWSIKIDENTANNTEGGWIGIHPTMQFQVGDTFIIRIYTTPSETQSVLYGGDYVQGEYLITVENPATH